MHKKYKVFSTLEEACEAIGVIPPSNTTIGEIVTCCTKQGRQPNTDGRACWFRDGTGGWVYNWKTGERTYFFKNYQKGNSYSRAEKQAMVSKLRKVKREFLQYQDKVHKEAATIAQSVLDHAKVASPKYPYLKKKGIGFIADRLFMIEKKVAQECINKCSTMTETNAYIGYAKGKWLLVFPLRNEKNKVVSVQFIDINGKKILLKSGRAKGAVWMDPTSSGHEPIVGLSEGVATAVSVARIQGIPVVAGICAGNLSAAITTVKKLYPECSIQIFADDDETKRGISAAKKAANVFEGTGVWLPAFAEQDRLQFQEQHDGKPPTDYNDWYLIRGYLKPDDATEALPLSSKEKNELRGSKVYVGKHEQNDDLGQDKSRQKQREEYIASHPLIAEQEEIAATTSEVKIPDLCKEIEGMLGDLILFQKPEAKTVCAMWVITSYLVETLSYATYLLVTSPDYGCGKTTLAEVLSYMVYRPNPVSSYTAAAIFRTLSVMSTTLLLDEFDRYVGDGIFYSIINSSNRRRMSNVIRVDLDTNKCLTYGAFGFKAFFGMNVSKTTEEALLGRCIEIRMMKRTTEKLASLKTYDREKFKAVVSKCKRIALDYAEQVEKCEVDLFNVGLQNRDADNWMAIYALAKLSQDAEFFEKVNKARLAIQEPISVRPEKQLLIDVLQTVTKDKSKNDSSMITSAELREKLVDNQDLQWSSTGISGKPLSQCEMSRVLSRFGIKTRDTRIKDSVGIVKVQKAFSIDEIIEIGRRYCEAKSTSTT